MKNMNAQILFILLLLFQSKYYNDKVRPVAHAIVYALNILKRVNACVQQYRKISSTSS